MGALPTFVPLMKAQSAPRFDRRLLAEEIRIRPRPVFQYETRRDLTFTPPEKKEVEPLTRKLPSAQKRLPLDMLAPCSWRFLLKLAAVRNGIPESYILGKSRKRTIAKARHDAIGLVYQHTQMSMPGVGKCFGRDHTTILNSLRQVGRTEKLVELREYHRNYIRPKASGAEQ